MMVPITKSIHLKWLSNRYHQSGGHGQYGHCKIKIEPKNRGEGYEFVNAVKGGAIPANFIPAIEKGVKETLQKGIIAGYPCTDLKVTVYDGTYHEVDSSEMAFKLAGSYAIKDAFQAAKPLVLLDLSAGYFLLRLSRVFSFSKKPLKERFLRCGRWCRRKFCR